MSLETAPVSKSLWTTASWRPGDVSSEFAKQSSKLKSGESEALYGLAHRLGQEAAATPYFVSKGARCYRLAEDAIYTPARGLTFRLENDVAVAMLSNKKPMHV